MYEEPKKHRIQPKGIERLKERAHTIQDAQKQHRQANRQREKIGFKGLRWDF